ncbi:MAG: RNA 2',3'-cyclic phosphodiesterase [Actinobacteria bacterium]|nr:MAG: RNA 2',3'-cyclic phosphodiesterase [Actinomycetota bacterium]
MTSTGKVEGDAPLRLFLALRLPATVLDALERWVGDELSAGAVHGVRTVPREHLHVTLAFLGARPASELPAIVDALGDTAAGSDPVELEPTGYRETRSVGMVVLRDHAGAAGRLAADLHDRLEQLGVYRREAREWLPHMTVLRFRNRPRLHPRTPTVGRFAPSDAAAFLSRLHPAGARYEVLEAVPLGGVAGAAGEKPAGGETERMR